LSWGRAWSCSCFTR